MHIEPISISMSMTMTRSMTMSMSMSMSTSMSLSMPISVSISIPVSISLSLSISMSVSVSIFTSISISIYTYAQTSGTLRRGCANSASEVFGFTVAPGTPKEARKSRAVFSGTFVFCFWAPTILLSGPKSKFLGSYDIATKPEKRIHFSQGSLNSQDFRNSSRPEDSALQDQGSPEPDLGTEQEAVTRCRARGAGRHGGRLP